MRAILAKFLVPMGRSIQYHEVHNLGTIGANSSRGETQFVDRNQTEMTTENPFFDVEQVLNSDRRSSDRFPIERELRYRVVSKRSGNETGAGKTINFSSGGVLFTTEQMLIPGKKIEMAISWPAQLDSKCALKLLARGRIVRCENKIAAVEIQQYEFRTMGAHGLAL